jgi:anthranilate phosphoribosyltransferase
MAQVMRAATISLPAEPPLLDTAGTGGDEKRSFNISTVAAIIAAAAGARVAKQHSRAVTSRCGSTEFLEAVGVAHDLQPDAALRCLHETNLCFLSTSRYHPSAFARLSEAQAGGAARGLLHLLSLLAHPGPAQHQLIGVADARRAEPITETLRRLEAVHALIVCGDDGMDEITCTRTTTVHEVVGGAVRTWTVDPRDLGVLLAPRHAVLGGPPDENALITRFLLEGKSSPYRNIAEMNAGAALLAADRVSSLAEGVGMAHEAVGSGAAKRKLQQVIEASRDLAD